eukprot:GHVT01005686.1.p1 GENE.GHVT01005686.1~~GHVT01005686.1.p1  ORF type:complete len:422 (+),score=90.27 GHVT01005686.1:532-1797(+)
MATWNDANALPPCTYSLPAEGRALCSVPCGWLEATGDSHLFVAATNSLRTDNQIVLVEYQEERNELCCSSRVSWPCEVVAVAAVASGSCGSAALPEGCGGAAGDEEGMWLAVAEVHHNGNSSAQESSVRLTFIPRSPVSPSADSPSSPASVGASTRLAKPMTNAASAPLAAQPGDTISTLITSDEPPDGTLRLGVVGGAGLQLCAVDGRQGSLQLCSSHRLSKGKCLTAAFDPHRAHLVFAGDDLGSLAVVDLRVGQPPSSFASPLGANARQAAHGGSAVTAVDPNPNSPFHIASAGRDAAIKFWDVRNFKRPLESVRSAHVHWITRLRHNPFHDELVVSSGADHAVILHRRGFPENLHGLPLVEAVDEGLRVLQWFVAHEETVADVTWSRADAWCFASISHDGKVAVSRVPYAEKYRILL